MPLAKAGASRPVCGPGLDPPDLGCDKVVMPSEATLLRQRRGLELLRLAGVRPETIAAQCRKKDGKLSARKFEKLAAAVAMEIYAKRPVGAAPGPCRPRFYRAGLLRLGKADLAGSLKPLSGGKTDRRPCPPCGEPPYGVGNPTP